jgi:hypothetical protein
VPSVLAVPVTPGAVQPSADIPVEAPKAAEPKVETPPAEPTKVEPPKPEPVPAADSAQTAPASAVVEPEMPVAAPGKDERLIFRMDRTLRTPAVEPPPPAPVEAPKPAKKIEPPPQEEGPGYFERILEQIGF